MPSRAVYTGLAFSRSETGCSTILIPWVEESAMITPEVVGYIDPAGMPGLRPNGQPGNRRGDCPSCRFVSRRQYADGEAGDASPFLLYLVGQQQAVPGV